MWIHSNRNIVESCEVGALAASKSNPGFPRAALSGMWPG